MEFFYWRLMARRAKMLKGRAIMLAKIIKKKLTYKNEKDSKSLIFSKT